MISKYFHGGLNLRADIRLASDQLHQCREVIKSTADILTDKIDKWILRDCRLIYIVFAAHSTTHLFS